MTIGESIRQGFHYARSCRSLWIFGFIVGLASGGSSSGGAGGGNGGGVDDGMAGIAGLPFALSIANIPAVVLAILAVVAVVAVVTVIVHYVSEGALIEGIVRARQGGRMSTREGFRAGWAHFGVLLRIAILYFATLVGSLVVLVAPCVLALRAFGPMGGVALGVPALMIAVPWLITLHLIQAFAFRIAVLEHRHAIDAIRKARLFLHGRIGHGLKLIVAAFVGTVALGLLGLAMLVPVALALFALSFVVQVFYVILLGCVIVVPAAYVLVAMIGTFRSSVWTIGYVAEAQA